MAKTTQKDFVSRTVRMRINLLFLFVFNLFFTIHSYAGFADESEDIHGVSAPSDFSWRYYQEALNRFPDRLGIICHNAYELDKTGNTEDTIMFLNTCAAKGNIASMIYLASIYERGVNQPIDYKKSAYWMKRGADGNDEAGYSNLAAFHYGVMLFEGLRVLKDNESARLYLEKAKQNGLTEASYYLKKIDLQKQ